MVKRRWTSKVTLQDVADASSVSVATVSRVLAGHQAISEATAARVRDAMATLGYEPNVLARALRTSETRTFGLVVPDIANPFYAEVTKGAERLADESGYNLILCDSDYSLAREERLLVDLARRHADGVLLMATGDPRPAIDLLERREMPFVLMDAEVPPYTRVSAVRTDPEAGVFEATRYLIGLGHRAIAFLGPPPELLPNPRMVDAYRRALDDIGSRHGDLLVACEATIEGAYRATSTLLENRRPSAVIAYSDLMALGVYRAAAERGICIPKQLSVMGFDDTPMARFLNPSLTSVAQDKVEIGRQAVTLLLEQIKQGRPSRRIVTLRPSLVVRQSCAPPIGDC
jgi:LacI family transcriptional regulator